MDDAAFLDLVADQLAALPRVEAVTLGGSRAEGTERPDSDWDFSLYYRGAFAPQDLRDIGWPGEVSEVGGWGGGVFNGGAWLTVDSRKVDVHYRDLAVVDEQVTASSQGRFTIEPLLFHLAGIPSYLVLAELAARRDLRGQLPAPEYPLALRESASAEWWNRAGATFDYAQENHAPYERLAQCVGLLAQAASQSAHAVLAARGQWITNEKQLLARARLREVDEIIAQAQPEPDGLLYVAERCRTVCEEAVTQARATLPLERA